MRNLDAVAYDLARFQRGEAIHEARESKRDKWIQERKQELYKSYINDKAICKDALMDTVMDSDELIISKLKDEDAIEFMRVFKQQFQANLLEICEYEAQKQADKVEL